MRSDAIQPERYRAASHRKPRAFGASAFLLIAAVLSLPATQAHAAGAPNDHTVLIIASALNFTSPEAALAASLGFTVEMVDWTVWSLKSQADFATYRAIIIGDPSCSSGAAYEGDPFLGAVESTRTTWGPAVNGNVLLIVDDPAAAGAFSTAGGTALVTKGIAFAAGIPGKTGAFLAWSCKGHLNSAEAESVQFLDQFGSFAVWNRFDCFDNPHIVAAHPVVSGLTDADLLNPSCGTRRFLSAFPADFAPLVINRNATVPGPNPTFTFPDGSSGIPFILVKEPVALSIVKTGPADAYVGDNITYTITYGNSSGTTDATSAVITDPIPVGTSFVSATGGGTNVAGVATWNVGTLGAGVTGQTVQLTVHIDAGPSITNTNYRIEAAGVTPVVGSDTVTAVHERSVSALSDAHLWVGLRNSDDQGTQVDLRVELLKNGNAVASGLKRCITGLTRSPSFAKEAIVPFGAFSGVPVRSGDVLALRVSSRIGTNPDDTKCPGPGGSHNSAIGLRLYYDSANRSSRFDTAIVPAPEENLYLHSDGGTCPAGDGESSGVTTRSLESAVPTNSTAKCKDSGAVNFAGGNAFSVIGSWSLSPLP